MYGARFFFPNGAREFQSRRSETKRVWHSRRRAVRRTNEYSAPHFGL